MTSINVDCMDLIQGFNELYTHEYLENTDLALNSRLGLIICLKCRVALPKTRVKNHGEEKHEWSPETTEAVGLFLRDYCTGLHTKYPSSAFAEPVQAYEGLPIVDNYHGCCHCAYACQAKRIKAHIKNCAYAPPHVNGIEVNATPKPNISAQTYSAQNNQSWFQVICTNNAPSPSIATQDTQPHIQPETGTVVDQTPLVRNSIYLVTSLTLNKLKNRQSQPNSCMRPHQHLTS